MPYNVLLIDDELGAAEDIGYMWYYVRALRNNDFDVTVTSSVDDAMKVLQSRERKFDLVIFDIMMAPGQYFDKDDTSLGLLTGYFLAKYVATNWPGVPMLALTNISDFATIERVKGVPGVKNVVQKIDYTPINLATTAHLLMGRKS